MVVGGSWGCGVSWCYVVGKGEVWVGDVDDGVGSRVGGWVVGGGK